MIGQQIHIIGNDDIVILLGLLGIEGTVVENDNEFLAKFKELIKNPSIRMIIVARKLSNDFRRYLWFFNLHKKFSPLKYSYCVAGFGNSDGYCTGEAGDSCRGNMPASQPRREVSVL